MRMQAVRETSKEMNLNKSLQYCGVSKHAWYSGARKDLQKIN